MVLCAFKYCWNSELKYSPPLSLRRTCTYELYWLQTILWNFWNNKFTSLLDFIKHTQVILVQSSIKVTNQHDPPKEVTLDGPQTSECMIIKRIGLLFKINGNEARWLFPSLQTSHRKLETSNFANKLRNNFFRKPKEACPKRWCYNHMSNIFFSFSKPSTVKAWRNLSELFDTMSR